MMTLYEKMMALLLTPAIKFWNLVCNANRDLPYHDFHTVTNQSTDTSYTVGSNQLVGHGTQRKLFVSKSTLIFSTENQVVQFNSHNNIAITILANTWYEFKSNIWMVFYTIPGADKNLYLYFEGVLPEEARNPE